MDGFSVEGSKGISVSCLPESLDCVATAKISWEKRDLTWWTLSRDPWLLAPVSNHTSFQSILDLKGNIRLPASPPKRLPHNLQLVFLDIPLLSFYIWPILKQVLIISYHSAFGRNDIWRVFSDEKVVQGFLPDMFIYPFFCLCYSSKHPFWQ